MSLFTSEKAAANVAIFEAALLALADGKTFTHDGKTYVATDEPWLKSQLKMWTGIYNRTMMKEAGHSKFGFSVANFK